MTRRLRSAVATAAILVSLLLRQPRYETHTFFDINALRDFDVRPGSWFKAYLCDWMLAHNVIHPDDVTSGIAMGAESGDYIWATATPDWDKGWFNSHGWRFPRKWVPFYYLATSEGEPGDPCKLRGL